MAIAVPVVSIGCSGSSAVAGMLHELGCPMGHETHLQVHPGGFPLFEDFEFYGVFAKAQPTLPWRNRLRQLFEAHRQEPVWGWKNTLTVSCLPWIIPILEGLGDEVRVVAVHRTLAACAKGRAAGRCPPGVKYSEEEAWCWAVEASRVMYEALSTVQRCELAPILHLGFEDVVAHPQEAAQKLRSFVFAGSGWWPDAGAFEAAAAHVRLSLKHN